MADHSSADFGSAPPTPTPRRVIVNDKSWVKEELALALSQLATPVGPPESIAPSMPSPTMDTLPTIVESENPPPMFGRAILRPRPPTRSPSHESEQGESENDDAMIVEPPDRDPPPPPPTLPISAPSQFGSAPPIVVHLGFADVVDDLSFSVETLSTLFKDSLQASQPTAMFIEASYDETKASILRYARANRFYVKCKPRTNTLEIVHKRRKDHQHSNKKQQNRRMRASTAASSSTLPTPPPAMTPPPGPPPDAPPVTLTPRPPTFPPPNQPDHSRPSLAELARRRGRHAAQQSSSGGHRPPPLLPPPPPPPAPPAPRAQVTKYYSGVSRPTQRIGQRVREASQQADAAAGAAWAERHSARSQPAHVKRQRITTSSAPASSSAATSQVPWRTLPRNPTTPPPRSGTSPRVFESRVNQMRAALNSVLDAL